MAHNGPNWEALGVSKEEADRMRAADLEGEYAPHVEAFTPWKLTGQIPLDWFKENRDSFICDHTELTRYAEPDWWRDDACGYTGSGVYFLYRGGELVYVGKARDINRRIIHHLWQDSKGFDAVATIRVPEMFIDDVECYYIHKHRPEFNVLIPPRSHLMVDLL